jgi:hypothetical protein
MPRTENVDARYSNFVQAGRDINYYHIQIPQISSFGIRLGSHNIAIDGSDNLSALTSTPHSGRHFVTSSSNGFGDVDATTNLIDRIIHFLLDRNCSLNNHQDLTVELESLHQTLALTKLIIRKYDSTPLGQSLANTIHPEITSCFATLQKIFSSINGTRRVDFSITRVCGILRRFWCDEWDDEELAGLRQRLSNSR